MAITFDAKKRDVCLRLRGLDFADAEKVFAGKTVTLEDTRRDYGETRLQTAGYLDGRMVVFLWTPRGDDQHVFSMRYCHDDEQKDWEELIG